MQNKVLIFVKLLRLPFITASILPYLLGAIATANLGKSETWLLRFILGLLAVCCAHLSANVFNDYYDSKSGNDWQDTNEYTFFGGSKIIQKGFISETAALVTASILLLCSLLCITILQLISKTPIMLYGIGILLCAISYTAPPLKLAYRGLGEMCIFVLFGISIVCGAYTLITDTLFGVKELLLSLPHSFLITAILFANEVPDYEVDKKVNKKTLVVLFGREKAWMGYALLTGMAFVAIAVCVQQNILPRSALAACLFLFLYVKSTLIIKKYFNDIEKLTQSSKLTILGHTLVSLTLIISLLCK